MAETQPELQPPFLRLSAMISQYFTRRLQPCRDWSTSGKDVGSTSLMNLKLDKLSLDHPAISLIPLPSFAAPKRIGLKSYLLNA
jgi:hypothetical protein